MLFYCELHIIKKVLGTYASYADGVKNTREKLGTFIVQFCNGNKDAYTNTITSMNFIGE